MTGTTSTHHSPERAEWKRSATKASVTSQNSPDPRQLSTTLSVIVPAYNEQFLVEASLARLMILADSPLLDLVKVIVVDDGSSDRTRLALPFSAVLSGLVDFAIGFLMFVVLMIRYHVRPGIPLLFFPFFLLLAVLTATGVGLWLGALNALYRDVRYVVPFLTQFWLFASPVAYPASLVPAKWRWVYGLNPMAGVIEGFRWSLSGQGGAPPTRLILVSVLIVVAVLVSGLFYFQKMEATIADVV